MCKFEVNDLACVTSNPMYSWPSETGFFNNNKIRCAAPVQAHHAEGPRLQGRGRGEGGQWLAAPHQRLPLVGQKDGRRAEDPETRAVDTGGGRNFAVKKN